jgi:hypothetical protein
LEWNSARFRVAAAEPLEIGVDGEALQMEPPLVFEILPQALRVHLPSSAVGLSPAARSVPLNSLDAVVALVTIAGGKYVPG